MNIPYHSDEWRKWAGKLNARLAEIEAAQKSGVSVSIQNDNGEVSFTSKILELRGQDAKNGTTGVWIINKNGRVDFDTPTPMLFSSSSWSISNLGITTWSSLLLAAGTVYWYRAELCILARSIVAGANVTYERCVSRYDLNRGLETSQLRARGSSTEAQVRTPLTQFITKKSQERTLSAAEQKCMDAWMEELTIRPIMHPMGMRQTRLSQTSTPDLPCPSPSSNLDFDLPPLADELPALNDDGSDADGGVGVHMDKGKGKGKAKSDDDAPYYDFNFGSSAAVSPATPPRPSRPPPPHWYNPSPTPMSPIPEAEEPRSQRKEYSW